MECGDDLSNLLFNLMMEATGLTREVSGRGGGRRGGVKFTFNLLASGMRVKRIETGVKWGRDPEPLTLLKHTSECQAHILEM